MSVYRRHVRHSSYNRVRHGQDFIEFMTTQASRLAGTGASAAITFTNATNIVNHGSHGYATGDGPFLLANAGGALPAELDTTTDYWVNVASAGTYTLHTSEDDALAGSNDVAFTDDGTGTHTILKSAVAETIFDALLAGKSADEIRGITDVDNL